MSTLFDDHVLYVTARCYNMLKLKGLVASVEGVDMFLGFQHGSQGVQMVPIKPKNSSQMPAGVEMIMTNEALHV